MDKKAPRYTKNIFIAHKKHIMRTLNTLIKYDDISAIYIKFNDSKNKYECVFKPNDLDIDNATEVNNCHIYNRTLANTKLYCEEEILKVLDSSKTKQNQRQDVVEKLKILIKKYTFRQNSSSDNEFFKKDEETILQEISNILQKDELKSEYKVKNKSIKVKSNVEKKIYYLIKNQLTFFNEAHIHSLENTNIIDKNNLKELVAKEIDNIEQYVVRADRYAYYSETHDWNTSKSEIHNVMMNFYNNDVEKYTLSSFSYDELQQQLDIIEEREAKDIDANIDIDANMQLLLSEIFHEYNMLSRYIYAKKKKFSKNSISKYVNEIKDSFCKARKLRGNKRRNEINRLRQDYGFFESIGENRIKYFILKMIELEKYASKYNTTSVALRKTLCFPSPKINKVSFKMPTDMELEQHSLDRETYQSIKEDEQNDFRYTSALKRELYNLDLTMDDFKAESVLIEVKRHMNDFGLDMNLNGFEEYCDLIKDSNYILEYFEEECQDSPQPQSCVGIKQRTFPYFLKALKEYETYIYNKFENFEDSREYTEEELLNIDLIEWWLDE